jgi:hypothetical protein
VRADSRLQIADWPAVCPFDKLVAASSDHVIFSIYAVELLRLCLSFFAQRGEKTTDIKKESTTLPQATTAFAYVLSALHCREWSKYD